jgi:hypothetical protein
VPSAGCLCADEQENPRAPLHKVVLNFFATSRAASKRRVLILFAKNEFVIDF